MKRIEMRSNPTMKLAVLFLLLSLLISLLPAVAGAAQSSNAPQVTSLVPALNVRQGPGTGYSVIGTLRQNQSLPISGRNAASGWWQVKLADGRTGWVTGQTNLVRAEGDTSQTPEVAAPAQPASRSGAARGGRLVFQTASGGPIYIANADGSGLRKLTTGIDPALSPDGTRVAFTRWDSSSPGTLGSVWVINADGSEEKMVHSDVRQPKSPAWSPDGKALVISMQQGGTLEATCWCSVWSMPRPGLCPRDPPLDPNGREASCFEDLGRAGWGLRLIDLPTGQWQDQKRDFTSFTPTWDPINAWRVVFNGDRGLAQLDINRQVSWPLTEDVNDRSPNFSPNGQKIALSYHQHDHWDVHTINADGTGRVRITETPWSVTAAGKPVWNNVAPAYSPDNRRIAFLTDRTGQWELWTINADGSDPRSVFPPSVQTQLGFQYNFSDERVVSWR
jgi:dipeptidyl aminopeptidase/acylaminoacyl peptidase